MRASEAPILSALGSCRPTPLTHCSLFLLAALALGAAGRTIPALLRAHPPLSLPPSATFRHVAPPLAGSLTGSLIGEVPLHVQGHGHVGLPGLGAAGGVVHHHHHHVVVLQGGGYPPDSPPSKEAMAALLHLPRTLGQHQDAMPRSQAQVPPRVYQSMSTIGGGGVTHQYHFHSAQDLAAAAAPALPAPSPPPAPLPPPTAAPASPAAPAAPTAFPAHDPDAEWYARQQGARVIALLGKLRELGIHVDEVDDEPPAVEPSGHRHPPPTPSSTSAPVPPTPAPPPHKQVEQVTVHQQGAAPQGGAPHGGEDDDEEMKKELVNYLIKFQKKHKDLHADHPTDDADPDAFLRWKNRADEQRDDADVEAGGDLDVDVDAALEPPSRTTLQEAATLAKELGVV